METKEIKINLPIDLTKLDEIGNVTATIENGSIVIKCEPKKKEFKFGDFVSTNYINGRINYQGIVIDSFDNSCVVLFTDGKKYELFTTSLKEANDFEKIDIQHYLDENNLVIDYDKKEIRKKRWRAYCESGYYYINSINKILLDNEYGDDVDDARYFLGNYFRTREQAEQAAKEIRDIFEKHKND